MATRKEAIEQLKAIQQGTVSDEQSQPLSRGDAVAKMLDIQKQENPDKSWKKWFHDIDMALGQGVVKGAAALPGLPGDVQQLLQMPSRETDLGNLMKSLPQAPTSADTLGAFEKSTQPFKEYTGVPGAAERVGEFFTPTPGGKAKMARDVITSVLGAGGSLGGEALADQLNKSGTNLSPEWLSMLGSLAGVSAGQLKRPSAVKMAAADAPSPEALKTTKNVDYTIAEAEKDLDRQVLAKTVSNISQDMEKEAIRRADEPELAAMLKEVLNKPQVDFVHLDSIAKRAGAAAVGDDTNARKFGQLVKRHIDNYYDELEKTRPGIKEKVANAKEQGRSVLLSEKVARLRDPSELAKSGEAISEMDAVRAWAKGNWQGFTPLEKKAASRATGRATAQSPLRSVGRFLQGAPARTAQLAAALAAPWTGGMEQAGIALGSAGLGAGAERLADIMTESRLNDLEAVLRSGKRGQAKALKDIVPLINEVKKSGYGGVLGAIKSLQAETYERNKRKPK